MIEVKFKKLNENAIVPSKTYDEDFCYDCVATSCEEVAPNVYKYGIGLAFEIVHSPKEWKRDTRFALDFRPRSSVWKTGMVLSNCVGTIDDLYRGEVSAVFYHVMPNMPKYEVGDKIVQCHVMCTDRLKFVEVEELTETKRGANGYGSTGK